MSRGLSVTVEGEVVDLGFGKNMSRLAEIGLVKKERRCACGAWEDDSKFVVGVAAGSKRGG